MNLNATITEDGVLTLDSGGAKDESVLSSVNEARKKARQTAVMIAEQAGEEVRLVVSDPSGVHVLAVTPEGRTEDVTSEADTEDAAPEAETEDAAPEADTEDAGSGNPFVRGQADASAVATVDHAAAPPTFLEPDTGTLSEPAEQGWQGWMNRVLGLRLQAGEAEIRQREAVSALQQSWVGPRTIAVLNSKGGGNKTPTSIRLSAELARVGGGGVLAWDNNESLGTMGWRVETEDHARTVLDFITAAPRFLEADARRADLAQFVHHQSQDAFDALISDDNPSHDHLMTGDEVDLIHDVASRNWRLIVMDSGNSTRGENFARMIHHSDQVVLATTTESDKAQGAVDSWRALKARGGRAAELADTAVVVVSEANTSNSLPASEVVDKFSAYVRAVHVVPFDPALVQGVMRTQDLHPKTRRAWQIAAADVVGLFRGMGEGL